MQRPEYDRRKVGAYLGLGVGFAASALLFAALGSILDSRIGTTPLFTLIGVFVGGAAGFYSLYRRAMAIEEGGADEDQQQNSEQDRSRDQREKLPDR